MIKTFHLKTTGITQIKPLGYLHFLQLEANAALVFTDSGGVQEETCILKIPCITLRDNTERPETLEVGSNVLVGTNSHRMVEMAEIMLKRAEDWVNPFGDGRSREKILMYTEAFLKEREGLKYT
jgi:UDP-N-acetylglucosamine 2-epimerase (non-hydrolysing)